MNKFQIYVDADSCPVSVREIIIKSAIKNNINLYFVANHEIPLKKRDNFFMIVTDPSPDSADNYIVENATSSDIVITRDIPLAARLVEKDIVVINDRGLQFNKDNIKEKLSMRNFTMKLSQNGIYIERANVFSKKDLANFANCYSNILYKLLRK